MTSESTKITTEAVQGLARKLEALDLSAREAAVLDALLARAEAVGDDVQGFGAVTIQGDGIDLAPRLGRALGFHIHINP